MTVANGSVFGTGGDEESGKGMSADVLE